MFYSVNILRTSARETASQIALRDCFDEIREEPEYKGVFEKKDQRDMISVASTCNDLQQGLGSQPEIELAHSGESTDSGSGLQLFRKEFPQRQKVVKQVKYSLRGKEYIQYMWIDTWADSQGEFLSC